MSDSAGKLATRLRDMHELAADSCDPEFNRALIEAADTIDRLREPPQPTGDVGELVERLRTCARGFDYPDGQLTPTGQTIADAANLIVTLDSRSMMPAWQPIETAPKDGRLFLGAISWDNPTVDGWDIVRMVWRKDVEKFVDATYAPFAADQEQPTHWMPLPRPPRLIPPWLSLPC